MPERSSGAQIDTRHADAPNDSEYVLAGAILLQPPRPAIESIFYLAMVWLTAIAVTACMIYLTAFGAAMIVLYATRTFEAGKYIPIDDALMTEATSMIEHWLLDGVYCLLYGVNCKRA
jgi:hypothetical protein